jgi:hypothetical protein
LSGITVIDLIDGGLMLEVIRQDTRILIWALAVSMFPGTILAFALLKFYCRVLRIRLTKALRLNTQTIAITSLLVSLIASCAINFLWLIWVLVFGLGPTELWKWGASIGITWLILIAATLLGQLIVRAWLGKVICPARESPSEEMLS